MIKVNLDKIKQVRKKEKLSQAEMAELLGYDNLYPYHRKELGKQPFTAEEIAVIAERFNEPLENFFDKVVAKNAI